MADFGTDPELEAFRAEARAWLQESFPESLKGKAEQTMNLAEDGKPEGDALLWRQRIGAKGWGTACTRAQQARSPRSWGQSRFPSSPRS